MTTTPWKTERAYRILRMYDALQRGDGMGKAQLAAEFAVSPRSTQRDLAFLKRYIEETAAAPAQAIVYDKKQNRYYWKNRSALLFSEEEVVLLATILLESRALPKSELARLLDKMLLQCGAETAKRLSELIQNERFHYVAARHGKEMGKLLWHLSEAKQKQLVTQLRYKKIGAKEAQTVQVKPLGLLFSEMYFYLLAYNLDDADEQHLITYRVDRIESYRILYEQHFKIPYRDRFQEGKFRQQVQFMNTGTLLTVKFRFWGKSLEAVLDRLPNAKLLRQDERGAVLEAQVFGKGIKMWFLSQAEYLEVLEPESFRAEMKACLQKMLANYE